MITHEQKMQYMSVFEVKKKTIIIYSRNLYIYILANFYFDSVLAVLFNIIKLYAVISYTYYCTATAVYQKCNFNTVRIRFKIQKRTGSNLSNYYITIRNQFYNTCTDISQF